MALEIAMKEIAQSLENAKLSEIAKNMPDLNTNVADLDKPLVKEVGEKKGISDAVGDMKNCPLENGQWHGERGNAKWEPDGEHIPLKANPDNKKWDKVLGELGIDGIVFENGEPIFDDISKETVEIASFSDMRADNFQQADIEAAKKRGCSPEDVREWRKENAYTWHECKDMKTMQKVPSIVHNNISHRGGISEIKKGA